MCGRFSLAPEAGMLEELFPGLDVPRDMTRQRYNTAPTQSVLGVVDQGQGPAYQAFRWGLVPCWARDAKIGASMINARGESVAIKPAFRAAFRRQRCLVIADGFYEWKPDPADGAQATLPRPPALGTSLCIRRTLGALATAFEHDRGGGRRADPAPSCHAPSSPTEPNLLMRDIHDRMPVILAPGAFATWLDPRFQDVAALQGLVRPFPDGDLEAHPVSTTVNNPRMDVPECRRPIPYAG